MKRLLVILVAVLAGLVLFSCKSSTSPEDDFDIDVELDRDILVAFSSYDDFEETFASITVKEDVEGDVSLKVNGVEAELDFSYPAMGKVFHYFYIDYIEFGSTFDYEFQVGDIHHSGSIKHPDRYNANFPEFDINKDYTFDWTLRSNPQYQFLDYALDGEAGNDWKVVYDTVTLKPSARSYTLKKSIWSSLDTVEYMDFYLIANNMNRHGTRSTVYAYSEAYKEEDWEEWKTNKEIVPKGLQLLVNKHMK